MARIIVADMEEHLPMLYSEELRIVGYDITVCNDGHEVMRAWEGRDAGVLVVDKEKGLIAHSREIIRSVRAEVSKHQLCSRAFALRYLRTNALGWFVEGRSSQYLHGNLR